MKSILKLSSLLVIMGAVVFVSCKEDEPAPPANPVASFQVTPDAANFLRVSFINASQNATTYSAR